MLHNLLWFELLHNLNNLLLFIFFSREISSLHSLFLIIKLGYLKRIIYFYGDQSIYKYYKVLFKKIKLNFITVAKLALKYSMYNVPRLYTRDD